MSLGTHGLHGPPTLNRLSERPQKAQDHGSFSLAPPQQADGEWAVQQRTGPTYHGHICADAGLRQIITLHVGLLVLFQAATWA